MKRNLILLTISIIIPFHSVFCQWQADPALNNLISNAVNNQKNPRAATDGNKGAIIVWADERIDTAGDIYAQRINQNGVNQWNANGIIISNVVVKQTLPIIIEDGVGGAIIAWNDYRNGNGDIYAQRVDSSGTILWTSNGISVVTKPMMQGGIRMISDGAQGVIIVWQDSINGNYDVFAQRISSAGFAMWTAGGVTICNDLEQQINPKISEDGLGGAIICWQDFRNGNDYDIYAQRINSSGLVQWTANGIIVCNVFDTQSNPKIAYDHNNGAIVVWQDKRGGIDFDIYAQRLNSAGLKQWTTNGVIICGAIGSQSAIDISTDFITNGAMITWKDKRSALTHIYVQSLNLSGAVGLAANGMLISNSASQQANPNIVGDGSGGGIVVWEDSVAIANWDVYSQRINSAGSAVWATGGIKVGTAIGYQTNPKNISDGNGGCIYVFQDRRGLNLDIYAYKLNQNGLASVEEQSISNARINVFPNPSTDGYLTFLLDGKINWHVQPVISFYDLLGKFVFETPLNSTGKINVSGILSAGIYQYHLRVCESGNNLQYFSGKVVIEK